MVIRGAQKNFGVIGHFHPHPSAPIDLKISMSVAYRLNVTSKGLLFNLGGKMVMIKYYKTFAKSPHNVIEHWGYRYFDSWDI